MTNRRILISAILIITLLISAGLFIETPLCEALEPLYESRLDKGLSNTEPYSYFLMLKAREDSSRAEGSLELAKNYSPNLPAVYFEFSKKNLSPFPRGAYERLDFFVRGIGAYFRNFWWGFSFLGLLYVSLVLSFILSMVIALAIRLPFDISLFSHDVSEDRKRLFLIGVVGLLSFFGPLGFIFGIFSLIGLYLRKKNKAVVYAIMLFFFLSPFLLGLTEMFLSPPSPVLRSVVAVNEGRDNRYAIENLKGMKDFPALFSYALALKREGYYQEAIAAYKSIIMQFGAVDPRVYVNLGNAYYSAKDIETAKEEYKRSINIAPLPSAFYNLSQVSREMLDFVKGEEYFNEASRLSTSSVSRFTAVAAPNPNRFVADETLHESDIWVYVFNKRTIPSSLEWLFNGIAALIVSAMFSSSDKNYARRCKRCGEIFCGRCSATKAGGNVCSRCYASFRKADKHNLKERMDLSFFMQRRQTAKRKTAILFSYAIPGTGQIYAGEALSGLLLLWSFLFSAVVLIMNLLSFPGLTPFSHSWLVPLNIGSLATIYFLSIFHIRKGVYKGWL